MIEPRSVPATLRAIREVLDLTQEELAERLDVSFASVNRWEGGKVKPQRASREAIAALAEEAGVDWMAANSENAPEGSAEPHGPARRRKTRRSGRTAETSGSSDTAAMEKMLWSAACSIRGERDAAKFKDYLLPLLFLKRLSDVFDDEIARLEAEYGNADVAREIAEEDHDLLRFYLPPEARWAAISGREPHEWPRDAEGRSTAPRDVGEHLTKAVRAVVRQNPSLSGVIDVVDFAGERNGERDVNPAKLAQVIETFSDPDYRLGLADVQPDFLGRAYEFLLRKFAEGSGRSGGEFFTPTEVAFLMAHIMRPKPGDKCHDYACGSAGLLLKLQLVAQELDPTTRVPLKLAGQELQAESYATAKMNAIIHDMDVEIARGDTMINPKFKTASGKIDTHDIVVANPMWNQPFNPDTFANDPFDRFRPAGGPTSGKGDWAWLQHTLACLNERGRAAVVLDTGAVTRGSGTKHEDKERNIRKWFVDNDLIEGVILLPDNLFYNTTAAGVIVVLSKDKPPERTGKVVLLDASQRARKGRPKNYLPLSDVRDLADMFATGEATEQELVAVPRGQIARADYNLSPSRWIMKRQAMPVAADSRRAADTLTTVLDRNLRSLRMMQREIGRHALFSRPVDSETMALCDLCDVVSDQVDPQDSPQSIYIGLEHVTAGRFTWTSAGRASDVRSAKHAFRAGDVLYGKLRPYLDKAVLAQESGICTTELLVLRPKCDVDGRFLTCVLHTPRFVEYAVSGTTGAQHPRTSWSHLREYRSPRYSHEEQTVVSEALWRLHKVITDSEATITTSQSFCRSVMNNLLACNVTEENDDR